MTDYIPHILSGIAILVSMFSIGYTMYKDRNTQKELYKQHVDNAYTKAAALMNKQGKEYTDGKQLLDAYIELHLSEEHKARIKEPLEKSGSYFPLLVSELGGIYKEL